MSSVHRSLGLTDGEFQMIIDALGREPLPVELAMYSVMWSEHCSYKSSRLHLRRLPSEGDAVLVGPGENAGVVDVGDGIAIALRIESHNHPSAIEPYQGAATGIGGILRDVFTMGARPIALMDPLFFGTLDDPRSRFIFDGVIRGVAGYGNSVGVPTVGGQLTFARCYYDNPLVNVFCLGVLPIERLVLAKATGVGNCVVLLGSLTGRDGIGGVSVLASAGFAAGETTKRPSVQVGDPFEEKRLIEASLDLLDQGLVVGIQDLGGAGLACATSETAARGGLGMEVDCSAVPLREAGMSPVEIMTSESQERMLAIVEPSSLEDVLATCAHHEVRATVIGRVVEAGPDGVGRLVIRNGAPGVGEIVGDMPAVSLADGAPLYHRPLSPPSGEAPPGTPVAGLSSASDELLALLYDPSFVYGQYDHQLFLNTVLPPGAADATVLKLAGPGVPWTGKGLALTCDANPAWCAVSPRRGTELTVAEAILNVSCAGARAVAVVDCLNFGNPEHPEVMWQLSEAIDGMAAACLAFGVPVVGGNVSLYNESRGVDIDPTPVVGLVGVIDHLAERPPGIALSEGGSIVLVGGDVSGPADLTALGGSRWARELRGENGGVLPEIDFEAHDRLCSLVRELVAAACAGAPTVSIAGLHDVSDGGLAVCLAELCCASSTGVVIEEPWTVEYLFNEAPSRVLVCSQEADALLAAAARAGVRARVVGRAGGDRLVVPGLLDLDVSELAGVRARRLPEAADRASA
ncbi:MAG: phosphoribosylformylglycinamidine synthase subunit PurL [Acidimicrobiales bacterium]|jgi:phosphoribosylformylglycinamidine synthase